MELVEGQSLEQKLKQQGPFKWNEVLRLAPQICRALRHAHDRGVIHRDLKPANLLLSNTGEVKLTDFGIAQFFGHSRMTGVGHVIGTIEYMSPEQAQAKTIGPRSDLYSLGGVFYAMLSGGSPFQAKSLPKLLDLLRTQRPIRLDRLIPGLPEELALLIDQLLEKDPARRVAGARLLERRFDALEHGLSQQIHSKDSEEKTAPHEESDFKVGPVDPKANRAAPEELDETRAVPVGLRPSDWNGGFPARAATFHEATIEHQTVSADPSDDADPSDNDDKPKPVDGPLAAKANPVKNRRLEKDSPEVTAPLATKEALPGEEKQSSASEKATSSASEDLSLAPSETGVPSESLSEADDSFNEEPTVDHQGNHFTLVAEEDLDRRREAKPPRSPLISIQTWILIFCLFALGASIWKILQPPTANELFQDIITQTAPRTIGSLIEAEKDLQNFLLRFPNDSRSATFQGYLEEIKLYRMQRRFELRARGLGDQGRLPPLDQLYYETANAAWIEPEAGIRRLQAMLQFYGNTSLSSNSSHGCLKLAERQLEKLQWDLAEMKKQHLHLIRTELEQTDRLRKTDPYLAEQKYRAAIELYRSKPWAEKMVDRAKRSLDALLQEQSQQPSPESKRF